MYVVDANTGLSVPELSTRLLSFASALLEAVRVTSTVYVVLEEVGVS